MTKHFHNTVHARGAELERYEAKAGAQDEQIAALFRKHSPFPLSPSQIHRALGGDTFGPLTSVRRAVTNLERDGLLEKLVRTVRGVYGRPEHLWRLRREPQQARLPI